MTYTVRFAHLAEPSPLVPGEQVFRSMRVGTMGNSGSSAGAHLHLDVVENRQSGRYSLEDMDAGVVKPAVKQALLFIDEDLFGVKPVVTTPWADPEYYAARGKVHYAYDVVPIDRHENKMHYDIRWNRSMSGVVVKNKTDDPGYGNYVQIAFTV